MEVMSRPLMVAMPSTEGSLSTKSLRVSVTAVVRCWDAPSARMAMPRM